MAFGAKRAQTLEKVKSPFFVLYIIIIVSEGKRGEKTKTNVDLPSTAIGNAK